MISPMKMRKIFLCAVPAVLTATLVAQGPPSGGGQQPSASPGQSPSTQSVPSPGAGAETGPTGQNFGDQAFVAKALEGGVAEVQLGQLAEQKSESPDVKQFAQKMVSDHTQMGEKWFKPVAKQMGISEPKGPSKKDKKLIEKLQGLSGQQFDTEYIMAMVKDHKADLKDFQNEAQMAQEPSLKQIATQGATVISQHLQLAEKIAQAHNVPVEGKDISSK